MMKTPQKIFAPALAIVALAAAIPANAGERSATVKHADLDLSTASGQQTLKKRISGAVSRLCRADGKVSLREAMAARECVNIATNQAEIASRVAIAARTGDQRVTATLSPVVAGN